MKSHLIKHFTRAAKHQLKLAEAHDAISAAHKDAAAAADDKSMKDAHEAIAKAHASLVKAHASHGEHCAEMAEALDGATDDDGDEESTKKTANASDDVEMLRAIVGGLDEDS